MASKPTETWPAVTLVVDKYRLPKAVKLNNLEIPGVNSARIEHFPGEPPTLVLKIYVADVKYEEAPDAGAPGRGLTPR